MRWERDTEKERAGEREGWRKINKWERAREIRKIVTKTIGIQPVGLDP